MAELQICMLGSFEVCRDFSPLPPIVWRNPLNARLFKLVLVMRPEPLPLDIGCAMLGHGVQPPAVVDAVAQINQVLGPEAALAVDHGYVRFQPGPKCWIDVDALTAHYRSGVAAAARGEILPALLAFQEADALYQGDLLEELQESWVEQPRRRLRELYTDILERLAEGHAVLARYQDAVGFCHKTLAHAPLRESAYQRMMVYYYYLGDMAGSAEAYHACREALAGVGRRPSPETDDLWNQLSNSALPPAPGSTAAAGLSKKMPAK